MKVNKVWTFLSCAAVMACAIDSQAATLAFVGFNADGTDGYSLATFEDISTGTVINFTDDEWNGAAFADTNESDWAWTATSDVPKGTVINFINMDNIYSGLPVASASTGTVVGVLVPPNNEGFSATAETLYAFSGTRAVPTFLAAISTDTSPNFGGLTGAHAIQLAVGTDGAKYTGPRHLPMSQFNPGPFLSLIADVSNNWTDLGDSGDNSFDATPFTIPEPATWVLLGLSCLASLGRPRPRS
jgi:uncharacterized protein